MYHHVNYTQLANMLLLNFFNYYYYFLILVYRKIGIALGYGVVKNVEYSYTTDVIL